MLTNVHDLPAPFVRAVTFDPYDPGECDITVTGLLKPPQMGYLENLHGAEIVEDVMDRHWLLEGKALHHWLWYAAEQLGLENPHPEKRLFMDVLGWTISGQSDLYYEEGILLDYKRTHTYSLKRDHPDWEQQLNLYAHLWRNAGYVVGRVYVLASLRDWSMARTGQSGYPATPLMAIEIPLWSPEQAQAFLETRVRIHQNAREGHYLRCTDEETWQTKRCAAYCRVAQWCEQGRGRDD